MTPGGSDRPARLRRQLGRAWSERFLRLSAGGRWAYRLPPRARANLRWFWFDGVFASASDAVVMAYLSLFILALGASRAQIGLLSSLSSLTAALLLLPGAALVERLGRRKPVAMLGGVGLSRFLLLPLAAVPLVLGGQSAVWAAIAIQVVRDALNNLGNPATVALSADLVPVSWRGRYFSSKNVAMGAASMVTTFVFGQLITAMGAPAGYQTAILIAAGIGLLSFYSFSRIEEPPAVTRPAPVAVAERSSRRPILGQRDFVSFAAAAAVWNLSVNVAGPFFPLFMVERLDATAAEVGMLAIVSSLAALPGQRVFGRLVDRHGPRRILLVSSLLNPVLPFAWLLTSQAWHVAPINLLGGFLWAGYNLASFNTLLLAMPEDRRPRYSALYQMVVLFSSAAGAALGGVLAQVFGYGLIFVISGVGRLLSGVLFAVVSPRAPGRR